MKKKQTSLNLDKARDFENSQACQGCLGSYLLTPRVHPTRFLGCSRKSMRVLFDTTTLNPIRNPDDLHHYIHAPNEDRLVVTGFDQGPRARGVMISLHASPPASCQALAWPPTEQASPPPPMAEFHSQLRGCRICCLQDKAGLRFSTKGQPEGLKLPISITAPNPSQIKRITGDNGCFLGVM